jgi:hypothetical protein
MGAQLSRFARARRGTARQRPKVFVRQRVTLSQRIETKCLAGQQLRARSRVPGMVQWRCLTVSRHYGVRQRHSGRGPGRGSRRFRRPRSLIGAGLSHLLRAPSTALARLPLGHQPDRDAGRLEPLPELGIVGGPPQQAGVLAAASGRERPLQKKHRRQGTRSTVLSCLSGPARRWSAGPAGEQRYRSCPL